MRRTSLFLGRVAGIAIIAAPFLACSGKGACFGVGKGAKLGVTIVANYAGNVNYAQDARAAEQIPGVTSCGAGFDVTAGEELIATVVSTSEAQTCQESVPTFQPFGGWRWTLERIRQPDNRVSDRDCSIFGKGLSIGRRRCLYLRRWTLPTSSGRRSATASPSRSSRGQLHAAGARGATRATCSTRSFGFCGREPRGPTCHVATRRTRPVTTASRSGSARACWIGCCAHSPRISYDEARWI